MLTLTNLATFLLVLLNFAGLTAVLTRFTSAYALARAGGVLSILLILFFTEHFLGLGSLKGLWILTTCLAIYILYRKRDSLLGSTFYWSEVTFYLAFIYSVSWRYAFPDIDMQSEHITDLYFINNYLDGSKLPPIDKWHAPYNFDFYYAFMHYSAAFMGRLFSLSGGMSYNLGFALIQAMTIALAWEFSVFMLSVKKRITTQTSASVVASTTSLSQWVKARWKPLLLTLTMTIGGTGFSTFIPVMVNEQAIHADQEGYINSIKAISATRFIGNFETNWLNPEKPNNTRTEIADFFNPSLTAEKIKRMQTGEAGTVEHIKNWLMFPQISWDGQVEANFKKRELPSETFSYQFFVGDYHPPVGSFFLLLIFITAIALLEHQPNCRFAQALMAITVPVMLITNAWIFPLHVLLLISWIVYRHWSGNKPNWTLLIISGMTGFILIQPFLTHFVDRSLSAPFKIINEIDRTPTHQLLMLFWPLLLMAIAGFFDRSNRKLYLSIALTFLLLLGFTEFLYVDDPSAGMYVRTNSTMKWWGYLWVAELMLLGAMALKSSSRWINAAAVIALLGVMPYSEILLKTLFYYQKPHFGELGGHGWIDDNHIIKNQLKVLQELPSGIVLESADKLAYTESGTMALFSNKPLYYGWHSHMITWQGSGTHLGIKFNQSKQLYRGDMTGSLSWLLARNIQYISWMPRDNQRSNADKPWGKLNEKIRSHYRWKPTYEGKGNEGEGYKSGGNNVNRVGLFIRKPS